MKNNAPSPKLAPSAKEVQRVSDYLHSVWPLDEPALKSDVLVLDPYGKFAAILRQFVPDYAHLGANGKSDYPLVLERFLGRSTRPSAPHVKRISKSAPLLVLANQVLDSLSKGQKEHILHVCSADCGVFSIIRDFSLVGLSPSEFGAEVLQYPHYSQGVAYPPIWVPSIQTIH